MKAKNVLNEKQEKFCILYAKYGEGRKAYMPFPRNFIEETKTIIEVNNDHIEQIEQSLKKKGYKIR